MKRIILITLTIITLLVSCNNKHEEISGHELVSKGDILKIEYRGKGDVVEFKMFEGLNKILKQTKTGVFEGEIEIPDLENGIFSYEIIVHQKDSTGKKVEISYQPNNEERHFRWIGKKRMVLFSKAKNLKGEIKSIPINSNYLNEIRKLTIYYPAYISDKTPIIYLTDGSVVNSYAEYVDELITKKKIVPLILVGVHSSNENRYQEYVNNGIENNFFGKHEKFFFKEVIPKIENELNNWNGKRYMYGFSNGAAFCMYSGINHPEYFEEIIAFSTADYISEFIRPFEFRFQNYPKFYMGAGSYEEHIFQNNTRFIEKLKTKGIDVQFKEFVSGHDYYVWQIEFLEYLRSVHNYKSKIFN